MSRRALVCLAVLVGGACGKPDTREFRDFERMRRQKRYDVYDISAFFANGAAMQTPPESTVSIEAPSESPPASTTEELTAGRRQYAISCAPCHGTAGFGGGLVATNLTDRRPPPLRSDHVASMSPGDLFAIVTDGKGIMPPLGWQLSPTQRWAVVAYVQTSLRSASTNLPPDSVRADSLMASYLQQVDSLQAAGAPVEAIARLQRPRIGNP